MPVVRANASGKIVDVGGFSVDRNVRNEEAKIEEKGRIAGIFHQIDRLGRKAVGQVFPLLPSM